MKKARNTRKAVPVVSGGGDNRGRLSRARVRDDVLESGMRLYAVGVFDSGAKGRRPSGWVGGPGLLGGLAGGAGGGRYCVENLGELAAVAARISIDMRNEYLLGLSLSSAQRDGKCHRVRVTVDASSAKLKTYY